jgi:hypothetical protein
VENELNRTCWTHMLARLFFLALFYGRYQHRSFERLCLH